MGNLFRFLTNTKLMFYVGLPPADGNPGSISCFILEAAAAFTGCYIGILSGDAEAYYGVIKVC